MRRRYDDPTIRFLVVWFAIRTYDWVHGFPVWTTSGTWKDFRYYLTIWRSYCIRLPDPFDHAHLTRKWQQYAWLLGESENQVLKRLTKRTGFGRVKSSTGTKTIKRRNDP